MYTPVLIVNYVGIEILFESFFILQMTEVTASGTSRSKTLPFWYHLRLLLTALP
jgi:hypothetical protein